MNNLTTTLTFSANRESCDNQIGEPSRTSSPSSSAAMRKTSVTTTISTSNVASAHPVAGLPVMSLPVDNAAWARGLLNQQKTGVPPLHQTLIDREYAMAGALLAAGADLSVCIQPPLREKDRLSDGALAAARFIHSKNMREKDYTKNEFENKPRDGEALLCFPSNGTRYVTWLDKNGMPLGLTMDIIVDFAKYAKAKAPQENLHYSGANALTLCLLSGAPEYVVNRICSAAAKDSPALINTPDGQGRLPLGIAAGIGDLEVVKVLLAFGASINAKDQRGLNAKVHALENQNLDILDLLLAHDALAQTAASTPESC